MGGNIRP